MNEFVQFSLEDKVAVIQIDDGKRNALSPRVLSGIYKSFDQAQSSGATVIITGQENVFSAGFIKCVFGWAQNWPGLKTKF